jgi:hypothetical protein
MPTPQATFLDPWLKAPQPPAGLDRAIFLGCCSVDVRGLFVLSEALFLEVRTDAGQGRLWSVQVEGAGILERMLEERAAGVRGWFGAAMATGVGAGGRVAGEGRGGARGWFGEVVRARFPLGRVCGPFGARGVAVQALEGVVAAFGAEMVGNARAELGAGRRGDRRNCAASATGCRGARGGEESAPPAALAGYVRS